MFRSRRVRESVLLVLGVITPIGILAVNVSAFVMSHLAQFRIGIAALALLSGLVLNGLTAWWLLPLAVSFAARRMAGMGGIIPVDEPAGKVKSPPHRRGARLDRSS